MATVAMLLGGAVVNALAFSGSNFLFSMLKDNKVAEERKRHDEAVEKLQAAQSNWSKKRIKWLDWMNNELKRQGHALHTFHDVDEAMQQYYLVTGRKLQLEARPALEDYYVPTDGQKNREMAFIAVGMAATALVSYHLSK
jgi:hypothetical protein